MWKDKRKTLFAFPLSLKSQASRRKIRTPHSSRFLYFRFARLSPHPFGAGPRFRKPCIWASSISLSESDFSTACKDELFETVGYVRLVKKPNRELMGCGRARLLERSREWEKS